MKDNKLNFFMVLATAAFFITVGFIAMLYLSRGIPNVYNKNGERLSGIYKEHDLSVKFTSLRDGLSTVYVRLKNIGLRNKDGFIFSLNDGDGNLLREVKISGSNIGDDEWVKFQFAPLNSTKGKDFSFNLRSDTLSAETAVLGYTDPSGNFSFRSYGKESFLKTLGLYMQEFSQRFFKDKEFMITYIVVLLMPLLIYFKIRKSNV